jgi:hypothetical protein
MPCTVTTGLKPTGSGGWRCYGVQIGGWDDKPALHESLELIEVTLAVWRFNPCWEHSRSPLLLSSPAEWLPGGSLGFTATGISNHQTCSFPNAGICVGAVAFRTVTMAA